MTREEMLNVLKLRIDIEVPDDLLFDYLDEATAIIYNKVYPFAEEYGEIPEKYHRKQIEIANYLVSKNGAEGETMHTEGQITRMYEKGGVPDSMLKDVVPMCGIYAISQ